MAKVLSVDLVRLLQRLRQFKNGVWEVASVRKTCPDRVRQSFFSAGEACRRMNMSLGLAWCIARCFYAASSFK